MNQQNQSKTGIPKKTLNVHGKPNNTSTWQ